MRFIITGFPRSRTAWFSAYLTTGDTHCIHEATWTDSDLKGPYKNIGTADSGVVLRPNWLERNYPDKFVVIHRHPDAVERSLLALGQKDVRWLLNKVQPVLEALPGLHVEFEEVNDRLPDIHEYLDLPYDPLRADLFKQMSIQSVYWRR